MRPIAVIPATAGERVASLLHAAGWRAVPEAQDRDGDPGHAVDVVRRGDPAMYVPAAATPAHELRRILVVHEGTRGDRAGVDAADEAAVASGAEIIVLHVPPSTPTSTSASLPFRIADHAAYDWAEWRDEFLRRFCRCSAGVRVTLRVGSMAKLGNQVREAAPDLVIVSGPREGGLAAGEAFDAIVEGVAPVLIVPPVGHERLAPKEAESGSSRPRSDR